MYTRNFVLVLEEAVKPEQPRGHPRHEAGTTFRRKQRRARSAGKQGALQQVPSPAYQAIPRSKPSREALAPCPGGLAAQDPSRQYKQKATAQPQGNARHGGVGESVHRQNHAFSIGAHDTSGVSARGRAPPGPSGLHHSRQITRCDHLAFAGASWLAEGLDGGRGKVLWLTPHN